MRKKILENSLKKALLANGRLAMALFTYELKEYLEAYLQSKHPCQPSSAREIETTMARRLQT
jgi:hypothetical protein